MELILELLRQIHEAKPTEQMPDGMKMIFRILNTKPQTVAQIMTSTGLCKSTVKQYCRQLETDGHCKSTYIKKAKGYFIDA